jgi:hypothetical protein
MSLKSKRENRNFNEKKKFLIIMIQSSMNLVQKQKQLKSSI